MQTILSTLFTGTVEQDCPQCGITFIAKKNASTRFCTPCSQHKHPPFNPTSTLADDDFMRGVEEKLQENGFFR